MFDGGFSVDWRGLLGTASVILCDLAKEFIVRVALLSVEAQETHNPSICRFFVENKMPQISMPIEDAESYLIAVMSNEAIEIKKPFIGRARARFDELRLVQPAFAGIFTVDHGVR